MKRLAPRPRGTIGIVDIGTSKVCCFIARREDREPRIIGIGHQVSRGVRNGIVVDIDAASQSILAAVHAAEQMAGETLGEVVANLSGGFAGSRIIKTEINLNGREITDTDMRRVLDQGHLLKEPPEREVIHSIPVGFSVDQSRGIRDPRGMYGQRLGVNMHLVTASAGAVRNLATCIGRCHLDIGAVVVSPYAAGLASLVEDETDLGVTVLDMGGGTTGIAVFFDGNLVFADSVPVGGGHVTNDIARGLSTPIAHAERMKTLYGSVIAGGTDERDMITVPPINDDEREQTQFVSRATLVQIIKPRVEEILEMVRDRLATSAFASDPRGRVILTGGASQLTGLADLATRILGRPVRIGRPLGIAGLPDAAKGAAFAVATGLLVYPQAAHLEHFEPRGRRYPRTATGGYFAQVGRWLRESF
jgi:cell division protein FtsA